jgi:hypothetical protein
MSPSAALNFREHETSAYTDTSSKKPAVNRKWTLAVGPEFVCFVLFCFKSALLEGLTRPMQDKRKAKSCPRGLNHLSRPPRVTFPPIWSRIRLVDAPSLDPRPNARPWETLRTTITCATSSFRLKMLDHDSRSVIPLADGSS